MMDRGGDGLGHGWPDFAEEERGPTISANREPRIYDPYVRRAAVEDREAAMWWRGWLLAGAFWVPVTLALVGLILVLA